MGAQIALRLLIRMLVDSRRSCLRLTLYHTQTNHVSPVVPDDRPVQTGMTYRMLFFEPLQDLLRCRVASLQAPRLVEWHCEGATRTLRLRIMCDTDAPDGIVRVHVHWWWVWKGWRRVPGIARAAHRAAYAVAAATKDKMARCLDEMRDHQAM
jgi:hypothetical protein